MYIISHGFLWYLLLYKIKNAGGRQTGESSIFIYPDKKIYSKQTKQTNRQTNEQTSNAWASLSGEKNTSTVEQR